MGEPMKPFFDATLLLGDSGALRARMARDGYLFVRGLLARDVVANVQRQVGVLARDGGWLRADAPVEEARADLTGFCVDPEPRYLDVLRRINHLEDYHALKHHPALIGFLEGLLGGPILAHPRVLCRNIFPAREEFTTKAHQDFPNVQGTEEVYTAWIPLIDIPLDAGPLQVAAARMLMASMTFTSALARAGLRSAIPWMGAGSPGRSRRATCCFSTA